MGLFRNIPSKKEINKIYEKVLNYGIELRNIIITENCLDHLKVNINCLEYITLLYDLKMYSEVMKLKYSKKYIEIVVRTILYSLEDIQKKAGNNIESGFLINLFINMSKYLNELASISKQNGEDIMTVNAYHLCMEELLMNKNDIENNSNLIMKIAEHFNMIINLPINII